MRNNDGTSTSKVLTASDSQGGHTFLIPSDYIPARSGYTFDGWAESASGSVRYYPGDTVTVSSSKILYAIWTKNATTLTYTVIYGFNDGTGGSYTDSTTAQEGSTARITITSSTPTRSGYTFLGWSDVSNATSALYTAGNTVTLNSTTTKFYAVWQLNPIIYVISFDANSSDATNTPAPITSDPVSALTYTTYLPTEKPVLAGKVFLGWSYILTSTVASFAAGAEITVDTPNTILYAVWGDADITWTLFFDGNGGTGVPDSISEDGPSVAHTFSIPTDVAPTRDGYLFLGWATTKTATSANVANTYTTTNPNSTLYAVWQEVPEDSFTLRYDANGGTGAPTTYGPKEGKGTHKTTITTVEPTREGYEFVGWSVVRNGEVEYRPLMEILLEPGVTTLYAVWEQLEERDFALEFDLAGGEGQISVEPYRGTESTHTFDIPSDKPTKDGMMFVGWSLTIGGNIACTAGGTFVAQPGTTTLYAIWYDGEKVPFYLHFETNGGLNGPADMKGEGFGSYEFTVPGEIPELENSKFIGWSTEPDGKPEYFADSKILCTKMVTVLYAQWESHVVLKTYTLHLDPNGGVGGDDLEVRSVSGYAAFLIPDVSVENGGYEFRGWALTPDGPARFGVGDVFYTKDPESTLYARWVTEGAPDDPEAERLVPVISVKVNGNTIFYNANGSTGVNDSATYTWVFGDGAISNKVSGTHIYSEPGEYTLSLRIICDGQFATVSETIVIEGGFSGNLKVVVAIVAVAIIAMFVVRYFGLA